MRLLDLFAGWRTLASDSTDPGEASTHQVPVRSMAKSARLPRASERSPLPPPAAEGHVQRDANDPTWICAGVERPSERSASSEEERAGSSHSAGARPAPAPAPASGGPRRIFARAAPPEARHELPGPGALIAGTFEVRARLGSGSMGVVLSAFDRKLERTVAIKLIRAPRLDIARRARFLREARLMAQVNHPNVVGVYSFGEHKSLPYIVMEHVDGLNLDQWLRACTQPPDVGIALRLLGDICRGISAVHAAGIAHLDLKPSNILLDSTLRGKVADFGVSMRPQGNPPERVGTPGYMAPETLLASTRASTSVVPVDVYALGCIAYEVLTGTHPFRSQDEHVVVAPTSARQIVPPSRRRSALPKTLDRVIVQALEWDGARRPSMDVFQRALSDASERRRGARGEHAWAGR